MQSRIHDNMKAILEDAGSSRERKRLVYEFGELLAVVEGVAERADTPESTRDKAIAFLNFLAEKEAEHGAQFCQEAFLLNIVGEGMARLNYLAQPVVAFLRSALYFHGIAWVERYQSAQSLAYLSAHADLVMDMTSRRGLKEVIAKAAERFAEERPFCLSNIYLAELKKRYWAERRKTEDACDQSISLQEENGVMSAASSVAVVDRDALPVSGKDRVQVMLDVFSRDLSELGQRIYLLRHPIAAADLKAAAPSLEAQLEAMLAGEDLAAGSGKLAWSELSNRLEISEKVAKKEYLRALHGLLSGAAREMYGDKLPSGFVRRVLETLMSILRERDLRIRENAGRGMTKLVERWEIALRFVLNHERLTTSSARDDDQGLENTWG